MLLLIHTLCIVIAYFNKNGRKKSYLLNNTNGDYVWTVGVVLSMKKTSSLTTVTHTVVPIRVIGALKNAMVRPLLTHLCLGRNLVLKNRNIPGFGAVSEYYCDFESY
jgi:hypothetical protein